MGLDTFTGNEACRWGIEHEKDGKIEYMRRTGNKVDKFGFKTHPDHDWLGGSPDGLVGEQGMIEIKCPFYRKECHKKIPAHYYCQMNGLMEIYDREWCDYVCWTPSETTIYRVFRDRELWDYLYDRYELVWAAMKAGCSKMPNVSKGEKADVLERIDASDLNTRYDYWLGVTPEAMRGELSGPPDDPFAEADSSSEEEPHYPTLDPARKRAVLKWKTVKLLDNARVSKRSIDDVSSGVRLLSSSSGSESST